MKKYLFCVLAIFACYSLFAQQQPVVAVAPFDAISGISTTDANMITRVFFIRLGNTNKVSLVDRNVVDRVLREHSFQTGDWSNQQKTAELGSALNADWIVRGELEKFGNNILVTVQFYDIRTFRFMGGSDLLLANAEEAMSKMDPLVNKLVETISASPASSTSVRQIVPSSITYNIGDRGPGGGIIFSTRDGKIFEVSDELGDGHPYEAAVTLANNYEGGGFFDWRLPTIDELNLMYVNLRQRNLGDFKTTTTMLSKGGFSNGIRNDYYWAFDLRLLGFNDGNQTTGSPTAPFRVRVVREIKTTDSNRINSRYVVGDRGPGGGIIFSARNGRFLEVSDEIGDGHPYETAVTLAKNYENGGFHDWRLPTINELNIMYVNLRLRNLGGFRTTTTMLSKGGFNNGIRNDYYWAFDLRLLGFSDGNQTTGSPTAPFRVRAVREFRQ